MEHKSATYLGIHLDCHLNFRQHINFLESKIAKPVGILTKLKHVLPEKALIGLYYVLVNSHLLHGLTVWGGISKTSLDKLNTLQNKAVKIVAGARYFDYVTPHYSNLKILKLPDLYNYEIAKTMHRCVHNNFPLHHLNMFVKRLNILSKKTKLASKKYSLQISRYTTTKLQRNFKYQGVEIWNSIPELQQILPFSWFKKTYKQNSISNYE